MIKNLHGFRLVSFPVKPQGTSVNQEEFFIGSHRRHKCHKRHRCHRRHRWHRSPRFHFYSPDTEDATDATDVLDVVAATNVADTADTEVATDTTVAVDVADVEVDTDYVVAANAANFVAATNVADATDPADTIVAVDTANTADLTDAADATDALVAADATDSADGRKGNTSRLIETRNRLEERARRKFMATEIGKLGFPENFQLSLFPSFQNERLRFHMGTVGQINQKLVRLLVRLHRSLVCLLPPAR